MHPPWYRALTGCLQMIVRSDDDIEVEAGEVKVGEIRERAFAELPKSLDDAHMLSFAWLALADLACWPQLPVPTAAALVQSLESGRPFQPEDGGRVTAIAAEATRGAVGLLAMISQATKRLAAPATTPVVDATVIRVCANGLAKASHEAVTYWEKWLRRLVPAAGTLDPNVAKSLALAALRTTFAVPARWKYAAAFKGRGSAVVSVSAVTAGKQSGLITKLGSFVDLDPVDRQINAKFTPEIPVDPYRMGYLFHSAYMADLLEDAQSGYYDMVTCTNTATQETWSYSRL